MNATKFFRVAAGASALLLGASATAIAQNGKYRSSMLVSTSWLADHAKDANLVVLQVGPKAQYDSVHIPGSRSVALSEISLSAAESKLSLELPPAARLKAWAEGLGINNNSRIIVVPSDNALQSATRVFITLAYMGAMDRTSLLNGGLLAWKGEARPLTADATAPAVAGSFDLKLRPELIAAMQDVEKAIADNKVSVVDARLEQFYNGNGGGYPRAGHIPNAKNIPLNTVSANGFLKDEASLRQLFSTAGVANNSPVITYCHIGQQATLLWFVATMLGYDARMYDGSFQEWSGTERLPVVGKP